MAGFLKESQTSKNSPFLKQCYKGFKQVLKSKILFPTPRLCVLTYILLLVCLKMLQFLHANHKMSKIKVVPYILGVTPGVV